MELACEAGGGRSPARGKGGVSTEEVGLTTAVGGPGRSFTPSRFGPGRPDESFLEPCGWSTGPRGGVRGLPTRQEE